VRFGFGGAEYEIDLSSKNASAFRKQLTPFIEPARRADGDWPAGRPGRRPPVSAAAISGRGRRTAASRSVTAGGSRWAWWRSTRPRPKDV